MQLEEFCAGLGAAVCGIALCVWSVRLQSNERFFQVMWDQQPQMLRRIGMGARDAATARRGLRVALAFGTCFGILLTVLGVVSMVQTA